jgi:hypothetical protein
MKGRQKGKSLNGEGLCELIFAAKYYVLRFLQWPSDQVFWRFEQAIARLQDRHDNDGK